MKKAIAMVLAAAMVMSFAACGGAPKADGGSTTTQTTAATEAASEAAEGETTAAAPEVQGEVKGTYNFTVGAGSQKAGLPYVEACSDYWMPAVVEKAAAIGYEVNFTEAYGGSIAGLNDILEATGSGLLDFGLMHSAFEPQRYKWMNYEYYTPFAIQDCKDSMEVFWKIYDEWQDIWDARFTEDNVKLIGLNGAIGSMGIIATYPIESVDDVKGHKISAGGTIICYLSGTGASAIASPTGEAYMSMQTGVYEGHIQNATGDEGFKLYEVAPYYNKIDFGAPNGPCLICNLDLWNTLPEDLQEVLLDAGRHEYTDGAVKIATEGEEENLKFLESQGNTIVVMSDEERDRWAMTIDDSAAQVAEELEAEGLPGHELFEKYYEFAEELGYTPVRKFGVEE